MTASPARRAAVALALVLAGPAAAQEPVLPPVPNSARLYLATEAAWNGLQVSDGLALRSGLTLPVLTTVAPGGMSDGLQVELDGWTRLAGDPGPLLDDLFAAGFRYQRHLGGSTRPATYAGVHYRALLHAGDHALAEEVTHEVGVSGAYELRNPAQGLQGFVLHARAARDFGAVDGTFAQAGLAAALPTPTIQWFDLFAGVSVSASDLDGVAGDREFGYAASELQAGVRFPLRIGPGARLNLVPRAGINLVHAADELDRDAFSVFAGLEAEF